MCVRSMEVRPIFRVEAIRHHSSHKASLVSLPIREKTTKASTFTTINDINKPFRFPYKNYQTWVVHIFPSNLGFQQAMMLNLCEAIETLIAEFCRQTVK